MAFKIILEIIFKYGPLAIRLYPELVKFLNKIRSQDAKKIKAAIKTAKENGKNLEEIIKDIKDIE